MSNIKDIYGLTPVQEGIYTQYYRDQTTQVYQLRFLFQMEKDTDLTLLHQSIDLLTLRHEVLRSAFAVSGSTGVVKQVVLKNRLPLFQVLSFDKPSSLTELESCWKRSFDDVFDLQNDSLFHVTILDYTDARFFFLHTHHIVLDGWCLPVLLHDLEQIYTALLSGVTAAQLTEDIERENALQTSFAQYVNWIRTQDMTEALIYWKTLLQGCVAAQFVSKEPTETPTYKTAKLSLSADLSSAAELFSKTNHLSVNTVFETALGLTLQQIDGTEDVVFGTVHSGRNIPLKNIGQTVGPFINTIPVRVARKAKDSPYALLKRQQMQAVQSIQHGHVPLSALFRNGILDRNAINTLFVFENYLTDDMESIENGALHFRLIFHHELTEYPLTVTVIKARDGYRIKVNYDSSLYTKQAVSSLLGLFEHHLDTLVHFSMHSLTQPLDLNKGFRSLPEETERLLQQFNDTSAPYCRDKSVYDLFKTQAEKIHQTGSIREGETYYSFKRLDADAARIDAFVRQSVGTKKQVVGVLADRSYLELAAIFGVVRGGNAYLPLSPQEAPERIRTILKSSGCKLVLAQKEYAALVDCTAVIEDVLAHPVPDAIPAPVAQPDDTLYVIFTSGSTGTPKGAMVSNRSVVNRINWMAKRFFDPTTVVMLKTPYTFDVSVWEIFGFAMFGFSLDILPPQAHYNQRQVLAEIESGRVTDLHFVPTVFEQFLAVLRQTPDAKEKLRSLRHVILSGESLRAKDVNAFRAYHDGQITVHNLYGPAECAVDVTAYACAETETDPIPIGKPIDNTQIYILDSWLQPVPIGVTGELCIAGDNVGQGYLNNPKLTNEKFIDNPFGKGKLYKTGDLARWRDDGNIIFVGRNDDQVKISGQRVEPGEIEVALSAISGIESAAVIVRKDDAERLTFCAFYTGKEIAAAVLRQALRAKLPSHMIPAAFVYLDSMPLNASGKTDRIALTKMSVPKAGEAVHFDPPQTELEAEICNAFADVLKVENIGRSDSFYDLGGTSIQMIQLLSRPLLETISPADFMRTPTPKNLALVLDGGEKTEYTYLKPLYTPNKSTHALILFSYGGGDASAFTALTEVFRAREAPVSLWYMPWLQEDAFEEAAAEIEALCGETDVSFYSHCAGAATALRLLDRLNRDAPLVRRLIAGGNVLPRFGKKTLNVWQRMTDGMILSFLKKAGLPADDMTQEQIAEMTVRFRQNTDQFFAYVQSKSVPTPVSTDLILSRNDPFTRRYQHAAARWRPYVSEVSSVCLIDNPTHYFQSEAATFMYEYLMKKLKEG